MVEAIDIEASDRQVSNAKLLPYSMEAEQSLLGGILLNSDAWDNVSATIHPETFHRNEHRLIFDAMQEVARRGMPLDTVTVTAELRQRGTLDSAGGGVYLAELSENVPAVVNLAAYAEIVLERSISRTIIQAGQQIASMAFKPGAKDARTLVDEAEELIFSIATGHFREDNLQSADDLIAQAVDRIEELVRTRGAATGLLSGFPDLDKLICGLQPADFIVVAGRPSMGKTSLAMNIAEHIAVEQNALVVVFSLEMSAVSLMIRMLASMSQIDQQEIRSGRMTDHAWDRLHGSIGLLKNCALFVDDTPALTPVEMRGRVRRIARKCGKMPGLIVVDYLQLMHTGMHSGDNRVGEISSISRSLKGLAKEMNCPVMALSQLNRAVEQRQNKRPVMSDLRESGAIEQDADLIMFIYRDEVYNEVLEEDKSKAEIIIGKHRNGPIDICNLKFLSSFVRFESWAKKSDTEGDYREGIAVD